MNDFIEDNFIPLLFFTSLFITIGVIIFVEKDKNKDDIIRNKCYEICSPYNIGVFSEKECFCDTKTLRRIIK